MALFALCCTADIPTGRMNEFLRQTYHNSSRMDCQPSLFLATSLDNPDESHEIRATRPPVQAFSSSFVGVSLKDIATTLKAHIDKVQNTTLHPSLFAILDERSVFSDSGLVVQVKDDGAVDSVRVHFDTVNAELIRIMMITFDIKETQQLVGDDGVFRTNPPKESQKGKPAPRKRLG